MLIQVPYFSQEAADAKLYANDCGVACAKMLLDWANEGVFLCNKLSSETALALKDTGLTPKQVQALIASHGLEMEVRSYTTLDDIKKSIDAGNPVIVLGLGSAIGNINAKGAHFLIVTGYDDTKFYVNDPYWWGDNADKGHNLPVDPNQLYNFMENENYGRQCLFVVKEYTEPQPCTIKQVESPKGLNFRAEPDGLIFLLLKDQSTVCLMPELTAYDGVHTWQHIYMGGYFGWVDQEYLVDILEPILPVEEPRKFLPGPAHINTPDDILHLREQPSHTSKIITSIPNAQNVTVLINPEIKESSYIWSKIMWREYFGWVANQYLLSGNAPITSPIPTPVQNTSWQSHIGPHYMGNTDANKTGKVYGYFKDVDNLGVLINAHSINPSNVFVHRNYGYHTQGPEKYIQEHGNSIDSAVNSWINDMLPSLRAASWAYHESFNEAGASDLYLAFEALRIRKLHTLGFRACVLNIASGNTSESIWGRAYDMVKASIECNALIGVHNYSQTIMSADTGTSGFDASGNWFGDLFPTSVKVSECWTGLRILQDARFLVNQGQAAARLFSSETGLDDMAGSVHYPHQGKTKGWESCVGVWNDNGFLKNKTAQAFYLEQLKWWAETVTREGAKIGIKEIGGVIYTYGTDDPQWEPFNVTNVL